MEKKQSEIAVISQNIETGLQAFEARKTELTNKVAKYKDLTIKDVDDKKGYEAVSAARKDLKAERVQIEKEGKSMRDPLTAMNKTIKAKEDELVAIVGEPEDSLAEKEKKYLEEVQKVKDQAAKEERDRIQAMYDVLKSYNFPVTLDQLTNISDEHYQEALSHAKKAFEAEETKRLAAEKEAAEAKEKELQRLADEKAEMERIKVQQEETARKQAAAQKIIDDENSRIAKEKADLAAKQKAQTEAAQREKELEAARKDAAAKEKARAEQEAKDKEAARVAKEEKDRAAAEKKARMAPDKDKLTQFAMVLHEISNRTMVFKNKEAADLFKSATDQLAALGNDIQDKAEKL